MGMQYRENAVQAADGHYSAPHGHLQRYTVTITRDGERVVACRDLDVAELAEARQVLARVFPAAEGFVLTTHETGGGCAA